MNIEITTQEYRDLLDILHIADVVMSGHRREEDPRSARHRTLLRKLYSLARGEGLDALIRQDAVTQTYALTEKFEENTIAHAMIDEFSDHLFWDALITRLSVRDAAENAGGLDRLNAMSDNERQAVEGPVRQHYMSEFTKNGIANLVVVERFDAGTGTHVRTSD
ncbi:MAG TPA: hypothetical protein VK654_10145 [Nitrospirota bacterium]|nr:hypothetical protein [Nitrospirota bacterium]